MKKLLYTFIVYCLIYTQCFAYMNPYIAGQVVAVVVSDSCTGGLVLSWHCENIDVTVGTPTGCGSEDTTAVLGSGAAIDTDLTPTPIDGSGTLYLDGSFSRAQFDSMTSDLVTEGKFTGYLNPTSFTGGFFLSVYIDINNQVYLRIIDTYGDARLTFFHAGQSSTNSLTTTDGTGQSTVTSGNWFYIEAEWKTDVAGNDVIMKICDSDGLNCATSEADLDLAVPTGSMDRLEMGYSPGSSMYNGHVDNIKVYNDSKY